MAALHRLALERQAPGVAIHLPTLGGTPPHGPAQESAFMREVVRVLLQHPGALVDSLARTPQTNETGRAALLRCALSREDAQRPVRLREIGASAGLNLRADHLPGLPHLEAGALPAIVDRVGCDLDPVDIRTAEGRALLGSYVWVDDVTRFRRLADAMTVAERVPASVLRMDAADFAEGLELLDATTTLVWHSAMWVYLPVATQRRVLAAIARVGSGAGPGRRLVHASWEWATGVAAGADFALVTRSWDGSDTDGRPLLLATGKSHGHPVDLAPPGRWLERDPLLTGAN
jgi:hypothetical protein